MSATISATMIVIRMMILLIIIATCTSFNRLSSFSLISSSSFSLTSSLSVLSLYALNDDTNSNSINNDNPNNDNPVQLSVKLRRAVLALIGKFTSDDGKYVDYAAMKHSNEFIEFVQYSYMLPSFSLER